MHGKFNTRQRNYIILGLCSILLIMAAGYAAFRTQLNINGTSNITSEWKVLITNIQSQIVNGTPEDEAGSPSHTETTASFSTKLYSPGDRMQYTVTVENQGSIDAVLKTIETTDSNNNAILFEIDGIEEGEVLKAGEETSFTVDVAYNSSITDQPENLTSDLKVTLNYEQATGEEEEVGNSTNIGGNKVVITESGDGLYSDGTRAGRYVYKGSNPNNYIMFNDELWRIVAKEVDGTYKIVRNEVLSEEMPFDEQGNRDLNSNGAGGTYCANSSYGCNAWAINDNYENKYSDDDIITGTVLKNASLNDYLNGEYYNNLTSNAKGEIVSHTWNVGPVPSESNQMGTPELTVADEERITWNGKVALLSTSDALLANSNTAQCGNAADNYTNRSTCKTTNYLIPSSGWYWRVSPAHQSSSAVREVNSDGNIDYGTDAYSSGGVRPAVFLSSSLSFSGSGTESDPYRIIGGASE